MEIFNTFHIEAARRLPHLPAGHPCSRLHGHSFRIEVRLAGPLHERLGWVADFADIERAWATVHAELDHRYLNDIPGLENPTSEHLALWIWNRLKPVLPQLSRILVQETATSGCMYEGD